LGFITRLPAQVGGRLSPGTFNIQSMTELEIYYAERLATAALYGWDEEAKFFAKRYRMASYMNIFRGSKDRAWKYCAEVAQR